MKISPQTLAILRNFQGINPWIVVKAGSKLKVRAGSQAMFYAAADVEESFPLDFAISIPTLISMSSLFEEPDYQFHLDKLVITDDNGRKVDIRYSEPRVIASVDYTKDIVFPQVDFRFTLTKTNLDAIRSAVSLLKSPQFAVIGDGSTIRLATHDVSFGTNGKDQFSVEVGKTDLRFISIHESSYLKFVLQDYEVQGFLERFMLKLEANPSYWVPGHVKSKKG